MKKLAFSSLLALSCSSTGLAETLDYAVFPAPPFIIVDKIGNNESYRGIDVDIVTEIARRMKLEVRFLDCSWKRCLNLMENGWADVLTSAYKKPEREVFLDYFAQPYLDNLSVAFYFRSDAKYVIDKYEDLYRFKDIGVLKGASYFDRFDKDVKLSKYEVIKQDQLFPMVFNGRFDIMAGYVPTENYRLVVEGYKGKIAKSKYEYRGSEAVYMAISKKSKFAGRMAEIDRINNELKASGFIEETINRYYASYRP